MLNLRIKICPNCKIPKDHSDYYPSSSRSDGLRAYCKNCTPIIKLRYDRSEKGVVTCIYKGQKQSSKYRGHKPPNYTKKELESWMYENGFTELYNQWVQSGYTSNMKPSVDRLDDSKGYSFDNIQLITWQENATKAGYVNNIRPVIQLKLDGSFIREFKSVSEASRVTGSDAGTICKVCNGRRNKHNNFKWKYKDE